MLCTVYIRVTSQTCSFGCCVACRGKSLRDPGGGGWWWWRCIKRPSVPLSDSWRHYRCLSPPSSLTALAHTGTHALTVKLYTLVCSRGVEHRPLSRGLASFYSSSVHLSPPAGVSGLVSAGVHSHHRHTLLISPVYVSFGM